MEELDEGYLANAYALTDILLLLDYLLVALT